MFSPQVQIRLRLDRSLPEFHQYPQNMTVCVFLQVWCTVQVDWYSNHSTFPPVISPSPSSKHSFLQPQPIFRLFTHLTLVVSYFYLYLYYSVLPWQHEWWSRSVWLCWLAIYRSRQAPEGVHTFVSQYSFFQGPTSKRSVLGKIWMIMDIYNFYAVTV